MSIHPLLNANAKLAKVLLVPHVLVRLLGLRKLEHLLVNNRLDVVGLDSTGHLLHQRSAADIHTPDGADVRQRLQETRLLLRLCTAQESNNGDHAVEADRLQRLLHGTWPADLEHVLHAHAARQLLGRLAPVRVFFVVDDVVCAELLQSVRLVLRRGGRDHPRAGGLGELHREDRDAACALGQDPVARGESAVREAVEGVPGCQACTGQGGAFKEVEVAGESHEALLIVDTVFLERAIDESSSAGVDGVGIDGASQVALIEEGDDFVADLEAGCLVTDSFDDSGTVRGWDNVVTLPEWVFALYEISVSSRS